MTRLWPLLVVIAAAVALVVLFVLPDEEEDTTGGLLDQVEEEMDLPPELRGLPPSERNAYLERMRREAERRAAEEAAKQPRDLRSETVLAKGVVLDAEGEKPVKGVLVWWTPAREPCPRMAQPYYTDSFENPGEQPSTGPTQVSTNAKGEFRLIHGLAGAASPNNPAPASIDVFAYARNHLFHASCAVRVPGELEIRLEKGLALKGRVTNTRGRVVARAAVKVTPAPETPNEPGHSNPFEPAISNDKGRFEVLGLVPGAVMVTVDHPAHMPHTVGPHDPQDGEDVEVELVPALRATFRLRTDDGRNPEHPTLVWQTVEQPPRGDVHLLRPQTVIASSTMERGAESDWTSLPVRLPCDAPSVVLKVKADGYATWTSEPLRLPPEGGEETFEVKLTGDYATGRIKLSLEDDRGEKVHYQQAGVDLAIGRLDPGAKAAAYVLQQSADLAITDLPAGTYRLLLRSAAFAPAEVDVTVYAGQEAESLVRVRPPAKLKVRFVAPEATLVRFRLTQGGQVVHGVPEGSFQRGTDEKTGEPILSAGADGILLSGLAAGSYHVEVLSEDLVAPATLVHLKEGDTVETEIAVRYR